jgi:hypothetical protein
MCPAAGTVTSSVPATPRRNARLPGAGSEEVLPRHRGEGRLDLRISDAGGRRDLLPIGPPDDLQFALAIHLGRVWLVRRSGQDSTAFECRVLAANRNPVADPMPAETMFPLPVERRPIQVLDPHCRFIDIGTAAGAPSSARLIVLPHPIALRDAQPRRLDVDVRQKVIIRWLFIVWRQAHSDRDVGPQSCIEPQVPAHRAAAAVIRAAGRIALICACVGCWA